MIEVKIVLEEGGVMPKKATDGSAAFDLYCPENTKINLGRNLVSTKLRIQLPSGYGAYVRPRSGFSLKGIEGVDINGDRRRLDADVIVGLVDSDYVGEVGVIIYSQETFTLEKGTRFAQLAIQKFEDAEFKVVGELDKTERGECGFNSTGTK